MKTKDKIVAEGTCIKFLTPDLCTYYDDKPFPYPAPAPGEKWGPWFEHPDPAEPDGQACGPGRLHGMKSLNVCYAPKPWWPWWVEWSGLIGEDSEKVAVRYMRLRRITRPVFWKALRHGWGKNADLRSADLSYANLRSADLRSADLRSADLSYANLRSANLSYADLRSADLSYAESNKYTIWPDGFTVPETVVQI